MTTYDNRDRAERGRTALQAYIEARNEAFENSSSEIVDLIADLLHLEPLIAMKDTSPFDSTLRLARMHFEAERAEKAVRNEHPSPQTLPRRRDRVAFARRGHRSAGR